LAAGHAVDGARLDVGHHEHGQLSHASKRVSPASPSVHGHRPRTLLWIPVHISEPTANVEAVAQCMFARHAPSLAGEGFDVLITLAGNVSDGREPELARIVRQATAHIAPARPTVRVEYVHVDKDTYDKDHGKARRSSYAGPNTVFYSLMAGGEAGPDGGGGEGQAVHAAGAAPDDTVTDDSSPVFIPGRRSVTDTFMPAAPNATALHARHIAPYTFVQVLETDCCALKAGWLDVLLAPMLADPGVLMSGSRTRASCYSSGDASACKTRVAAHLRLHVNGNAMYRTGRALRAIIRAARDEMLDVAPFDLAMYFVRKDNQSHVYDNPRMYSVGAPVDAAHWDDTAYYSLDQDVVWVHAPRRLRVDGVASVVHRADTDYPAVAVVVAPSVSTPGHAGGGAPAPHKAGAPAPASLAIDVPLLRNCHASLRAAQAGRNLAYIALTWSAFVEASRVAPFRVVLANGTGGRDGHEPWPHPDVLASRALLTIAALARAGMHTLVLGTDAAMVRPDVVVDLATLGRHKDAGGDVVEDGGGPTLRLLQAPSGAAPLASQPQSSVLDVGMMQVPAGDAVAAFLEHWAAERGKGSPAAAAHPSHPSSSSWSHAATVMAGPSTCKVRRWTDCAWRGTNLTVAWLPAEAYAAGASYWGPAWTAAARTEAAFVVAAGVVPAGGSRAGTTGAPPEFRLRHAGLWHSGPAAGCANYSAVARLPMPLGPDVFSLHRALARHADFLGRLARHRIACAVLPGFTLASTGNTVPFDTVLRADVVAELASGGGNKALTPAVRFFPSAASLDVEYGSFVDVEGGARPRRRHRRPGSRTPGIEPGALTQNAGSAVVAAPGQADKSPPSTARQQGRRLLAHGPLPPSRTTTTTTTATTSATRTSAATAHACAVFGLPDASCFAPGVAAAIHTAAAALPPRFWCVADPGRSLAEAAVLALEGRLHEVDGLIQRAVGGEGTTILLTGAAWRATAAARAAGDRGTHVLTLADLPGVPSSDPIVDLVRPDTPAPLSSAAASPWADVIEYALCQAAAGVRFLPAGGVPGVLATSPTPSSLLPRLAARVPPSLLQEDLDALAAWLARPDRPGLGGRWVRTRWARRRPGTPGGRHNASIRALPELTPAQGADMVTATVRQIHALDAPLGIVPGLPPDGPGACTGHCQPLAWSAAFGPAVLRDMYGSTHSQLLPPAAAVLMLPDAGLDVFRGDGLPVVVGGPGFPASTGQVLGPRNARTAAAVRRVLGARAGLRAGPGLRPRHPPPPTMWVNALLEPDRLGRLKHFVGEGSVVVLDHEL
jgi:hypothetical protein